MSDTSNPDQSDQFDCSHAHCPRERSASSNFRFAANHLLFSSGSLALLCHLAAVMQLGGRYDTMVVSVHATHPRTSTSPNGWIKHMMTLPSRMFNISQFTKLACASLAVGTLTISAAAMQSTQPDIDLEGIGEDVEAAGQAIEKAANAIEDAVEKADDSSTGWHHWRGPKQQLVSLEENLPDQVSLDDDTLLWTYDLRGRGAPVIAGDRVYGMGYEGEGPDLEEIVYCLDAKTGKLIWEHRFSDFVSDIIYDRYAITSPNVDSETGNVYCLTTPGLLNCFTGDGEKVWQVSMMEEFGRFTYPNGRTLGPTIDGERIIIHTMTSSWGPYGPARDRFFAFDKETGENIWSSTPGGPPKDSPYSYPTFEWRNGKRLLYAGTAGGNMVAVNALTGDPVWRFRMSIGGVCASPVIYKDTLIAWHGRENLDSSEIGRMIAIKLGATPENPQDGPVELSVDEHEKWRNELGAFTSSLVLVGDRVYGTDTTGELVAVDADSGKILWKEKFGSSQIHASPLYADGKLYIPMNDGTFHIVRPTDDGPERLAEVQLEGNCLGAPAIWDGRIYVHTTEKLYCFGRESAGEGVTVAAMQELTPMEIGEAVRLQVIPAEVTLTGGDEVEFKVRSLDANGRIVDESVEDITWGETPLNIEIDNRKMRVADDAAGGAGVLTAQSGDLKGSSRIRIVNSAPWTEDFEDINLEDSKPGFPPSEWIQVKVRWSVVEDESGNKVLRQNLDNSILQRSMGFLGDPDESNYTMQMDIMSDGNRRSMSSAGMVNQRYLIVLKGNYREIEVSSNMERVKEAVKFSWKPKVWYTLKSRVDVDDAGVATIRAKAWPRDEEEPEEWLIEVEHQNGHAHGAPGLYGFVPQSRFHVYVDNISVTPNE